MKRTAPMAACGVKSVSKPLIASRRGRTSRAIAPRLPVGGSFEHVFKPRIDERIAPGDLIVKARLHLFKPGFSVIKRHALLFDALLELLLKDAAQLIARRCRRGLIILLHRFGVPTRRAPCLSLQRELRRSNLELLRVAIQQIDQFTHGAVVHQPLHHAITQHLSSLWVSFLQVLPPLKQFRIGFLKDLSGSLAELLTLRFIQRLVSARCAFLQRCTNVLERGASVEIVDRRDDFGAIRFERIEPPFKEEAHAISLITIGLGWRRRRGRGADRDGGHACREDAGHQQNSA
jgi:hypothetical protein